MTRYFTDRRDSWVIALDGNVVTGETYKAKEVIKGALGGRWEAERKVWIVDLAKVEKATKSSTGLYDASEEQIAIFTATVKPQRSFTSGTYIAADGVRVCSKCHTVCYGDCTAN